MGKLRSEFRLRARSTLHFNCQIHPQVSFRGIARGRPTCCVSERSSVCCWSLTRWVITTKKSALSRHEKQLVANGARMRKATRNGKVKRGSGRTLTAKQKRELAALAALPDHQIDTSDIPELPPGAWKDAVRGRFYRPVKQAVY